MGLTSVSLPLPPAQRIRRPRAATRRTRSTSNLSAWALRQDAYRSRFILTPILCRAFCRRQVWYDNRADDLTKDGMLKGIEQASAFVLFLSSGVLQRPYCQMEVRHALALKKPIVLCHGESEIHVHVVRNSSV